MDSTVGLRSKRALVPLAVSCTWLRHALREGNTASALAAVAQLLVTAWPRGGSEAVRQLTLFLLEDCVVDTQNLINSLITNYKDVSQFLLSGDRDRAIGDISAMVVTAIDAHTRSPMVGHLVDALAGGNLHNGSGTVHDPCDMLRMCNHYWLETDVHAARRVATHLKILADFSRELDVQRQRDARYTAEAAQFMSAIPAVPLLTDAVPTAFLEEPAETSSTHARAVLTDDLEDMPGGSAVPAPEDWLLNNRRDGSSVEQCMALADVEVWLHRSNVTPWLRRPMRDMVRGLLAARQRRPVDVNTPGSELWSIRIIRWLIALNMQEVVWSALTWVAGQWSEAKYAVHEILTLRTGTAESVETSFESFDNSATMLRLRERTVRNAKELVEMMLVPPMTAMVYATLALGRPQGFLFELPGAPAFLLNRVDNFIHLRQGKVRLATEQLESQLDRASALSDASSPAAHEAHDREPLIELMPSTVLRDPFTAPGRGIAGPSDLELGWRTDTVMRLGGARMYMDATAHWTLDDVQLTEGPCPPHPSTTTPQGRIENYYDFRELGSRVEKGSGLVADLKHHLNTPLRAFISKDVDLERMAKNAAIATARYMVDAWGVDAAAPPRLFYLVWEARTNLNNWARSHTEGHDALPINMMTALSLTMQWARQLNEGQLRAMIHRVLLDAVDPHADDEPSHGRGFRVVIQTPLPPPLQDISAQEDRFDDVASDDEDVLAVLGRLSPAQQEKRDKRAAEEDAESKSKKRAKRVLRRQERDMAGSAPSGLLHTEEMVIVTVYGRPEDGEMLRSAADQQKVKSMIASLQTPTAAGAAAIAPNTPRTPRMLERQLFEPPPLAVKMGEGKTEYPHLREAHRGIFTDTVFARILRTKHLQVNVQLFEGPLWAADHDDMLHLRMRMAMFTVLGRVCHDPLARQLPAPHQEMINQGDLRRKAWFLVTTRMRDCRPLSDVGAQHSLAQMMRRRCSHIVFRVIRHLTLRAAIVGFTNGGTHAVQASMGTLEALMGLGGAGVDVDLPKISTAALNLLSPLNMGESDTSTMRRLPESGLTDLVSQWACLGQPANRPLAPEDHDALDEARWHYQAEMLSALQEVAGSRDRVLLVRKLAHQWSVDFDPDKIISQFHMAAVLALRPRGLRAMAPHPPSLTAPSETQERVISKWYWAQMTGGRWRVCGVLAGNYKKVRTSAVEAMVDNIVRCKNGRMVRLEGMPARTALLLDT